MARNKDGTIKGGSNERVFFCCCCGCGCFPPSAQPSFPSRLALQYPEEKAECFVPPILRLRRLQAKRGRLRASGRTALRESLMRSRFKHWPFLKLQWISEISSGISHGDTNDQRSELAPVLIISRGGERRVVYIIKGLCLMNKRRAQKLDVFDLRWCLGRNGCPNYGKCTAKCQHMHMQ